MMRKLYSVGESSARIPSRKGAQIVVPVDSCVELLGPWVIVNGRDWEDLLKRVGYHRIIPEVFSAYDGIFRQTYISWYFALINE